MLEVITPEKLPDWIFYASNSEEALNMVVLALLVLVFSSQILAPDSLTGDKILVYSFAMKFMTRRAVPGSISREVRPISSVKNDCSCLTLI